LSLQVLTATAQEGEGAYRYDDATQVWRLTDNAATLGLDSTRNRGYALFNGEHHSGDYARVQEGTQTNQLRFQSERYQTIGKYLHAYGRFNFDYGRTKNRAWADAMRPYNATPFFSGSAIAGKYDFQDFDFTASLGTVSFGGWRFGLKFDYKVGDLSRLRDPRPRIQSLDYRLAPAVAYTTGAHTFALSGSYERRKEKLTGVKNMQNNATIKYYFMSGMEHVDGKTNGYESFWREWVDHRFGGELTYGYQNNDQQTLLTFHMERGEEYAYEQYKYEPGRYVDYQYGVNLRNRLKEGNIIHQIDIAAGFQESYADEYRQQLVQEKDISTGLTSYSYENLITFKKRYQVKVFNADLRYRAHFIKGQQENSYLGFHIAINEADNKYLLPTSTLNYGGTTLMAEGGFNIMKRLWIDAEGGGFVSQSSSISLADPTTDYAQQVLLPDMSYYAANYWRGHLQVTYQFPVNIKGTKTQWFVRAYGDYLRTNNHLDGKSVGLTIGLYN
jgi:hypothetical protein